MGLLGDVTGVAGGVVGDAASGVVPGDNNIVGDILTGGAVSNLQAQEATNASNVQLANNAMAFSADMSSTAYQRATKDMIAAGLNPMLAYSQGGASAPAGIAPTLTAPQPGNIGAGLVKTAEQVSGMASQSASRQVSNAQVDNYQASTSKIGQDEDTSAAQEALLNAQTDTQTSLKRLNDNSALKALQDARRSSASADEAEMDRDIQKARQPIDVGAAKMKAIGESVQQLLNGVNSAAGIAKPFVAPTVPVPSGPTAPGYMRY